MTDDERMEIAAHSEMRFRQFTYIAKHRGLSDWLKDTNGYVGKHRKD